MVPVQKRVPLDLPRPFVAHHARRVLVPQVRDPDVPAFHREPLRLLDRRAPLGRELFPLLQARPAPMAEL